MSKSMMLYSFLISITIYIFTSLAIYKVAKVQKIKNPWIAWIPIGNVYMLIKATDSPIIFIIPPVILFFVAGFNNNILFLLTIVATIAMFISMLYMYKKLCNKYNSPFWPILLGTVPALFFLNIYGQWKLYTLASEDKVVNNKFNIHSEVRFRDKKKK